ncbi:MAG TPA: hypothetical protein VKA46_07105, partial [Gemmataceae bacterium]|nr:hypothetical protein [Gemmataceae bacterium]
MGWQSPSEKLAIKERVRARDCHRCVVCGIGNDIYEKRYGKILDVHRFVKNSDYAVKSGVCVTLCDVCHDALHKKGNWGWIARDDPDDDEELAWWVRRSAECDIKAERAWRRREDWGAWLREVRETVAKVTQAELARSAGVPGSTQTLTVAQTGIGAVSSVNHYASGRYSKAWRFSSSIAIRKARKHG